MLVYLEPRMHCDPFTSSSASSSFVSLFLCCGLIVINALNFVVHFLSLFGRCCSRAAVDTLSSSYPSLSLVPGEAGLLLHSIDVYFLSSSQALMLTLLSSIISIIFSSSCCLLFSFTRACVFIHTNRISTHVVLLWLQSHGKNNKTESTERKQEEEGAAAAAEENMIITAFCVIANWNCECARSNLIIT